MKYFKSLVGLFAFILVNLLVYNLGASPAVFEFAKNHNLGEMQALVFGSPESGVMYANTVALLTMFSQQVQKRTRPNNSFIQFSVDESMFVNGEKVVTPVEGDDPNGITDPTKFPLKLEQKDDAKFEWSISLHATLPQRISDDQMLMVNYAAREHIINRHMAVIEAMAARKMLFDWAPTLGSSIIETTGGATPATLKNWGATGNRKKIVKDNFIDAATLLSEDDSDAEIYGLIPAGFYGQLLKIEDFVDYNKIGRVDMLAKGFIGEIAGIKILRRSTGVIYSAAGQRVAVKEQKTNTSTKAFSVATDDNQAILIWNPNSVSRAFGPITPYIDPKSGALLGSSVNFSQRAGGKKRSDEIGIVAIREVPA